MLVRKSRYKWLSLIAIIATLLISGCSEGEEDVMRNEDSDVVYAESEISDESRDDFLNVVMPELNEIETAYANAFIDYWSIIADTPEIEDLYGNEDVATDMVSAHRSYWSISEIAEEVDLPRSIPEDDRRVIEEYLENMKLASRSIADASINLSHIITGYDGPDIETPTMEMINQYLKDGEQYKTDAELALTSMIIKYKYQD